MHYMTKNYVIKPIYNDENECINDTLSRGHIHKVYECCDGYYVAYKPITLSCILFMFIEIKIIHCHHCVIFAMKSMSMYND